TGTCFGTDCAGTQAQGQDDKGHGTHVAGIIGAADTGHGMVGQAPAVTLMPVKVLDSTGSGSYSSITSGISYAATPDANIINMSLGGTATSASLQVALEQAAPTTAIFAAAGNSGVSTPLYPAAYATDPLVAGSMLIVGSVNASNQISSFSNRP